MKKRLHDKKAGIAILISLIIISLAEVLFRSFVLKEAMLTTANLGEQVAVIIIAATILILTAKGMDRACYICYGAWVGYFAFDNLFELPGMLTTVIAVLGETGGKDVARIGAISVRMLGMIGVIIIGILLIKYMTDGTINNRVFNILSVATILFIVPSVVAPLIYVFSAGVDTMYVLASFNALYRLTMVFMFTFFAYDSAKHQLKKTDLTK